MAPKKDSSKVSVTLGSPQVKKNVTRFDSDDTDAALASVYVSKAALTKLGNPDSIKVTIEAA